MSVKARTAIELSGLSFAETLEIIPHKSLLLGYRGSIAHGTFENKSTDDKDLMGVCFGPKNSYLGLTKFEHKETQKNEWDVVIYEIRKYFQLLLKGNPNVLGLLWLPEKYIVLKTPEGQELIDNRDLFICKQIYHSFCGYAYAQLKRMTSFGNDRFKSGYMGAKRKELVEKYGFDVKNATCLIRLLRQGIELLNEGYLYVERKDAPQLLQIKHGEWSLEKVNQEAEKLFTRMETAYDNCKLPSFPNYEKAEKLLMQLVETSLKVPD